MVVGALLEGTVNLDDPGDRLKPNTNVEALVRRAGFVSGIWTTEPLQRERATLFGRPAISRLRHSDRSGRTLTQRTRLGTIPGRSRVDLEEPR